MPETAPSDLPLIDPSHLLVLTAGDPALRALVMQDFLDSAYGILASLAGAHEVDAWRALAHRLKGAALGVGARRLAALAHAAERDGGLDENARACGLQSLRAAVEALGSQVSPADDPAC